jgi:HupE/UreJ protein
VPVLSLVRSFVLACLALACAAPVARGHEVPGDVIVRILVRPAGDRLTVLVRAPLEAMQDITFPTLGPGYLDAPRADSALRDAAQLWLANNIEAYEGERPLPLSIVAVRASIPSDRSFDSFDAARAHVHGTPLPAGTQLPWQQALLDVEIEAPIASARSLFSLRPNLERLGVRVVTAVRFFAAGGVERVYQIEGDAGVVRLDPRWHQSLLRFIALGFEHILDGADHLLFLLCLVVPFRRELRTVVVVVTAFTVGHSVTLVASAYGLAPAGLWFPPLIETLIAASIFYMAVENIIAPNRRIRWAIACGFGLIHGFGFSFALQSTLQFAGEHLLTSLLAFNVGIELGQLVVLILLVPALNLAFRVVPERPGAIVLAVVVAHTAWHWLDERYAALRSFGLAEVLGGIGRSGLPWLFAALIGAMAVWRAAHARMLRASSREPTQ